MLYNVVKFICNIVIRVIFKIRVIGGADFPEKGPVIIYSNHKSMWDPIIIGCLVKRPVFFMAKEELFRIPVLGFIIKNIHAFPVKRGIPDRKAIKKALEVLNNNQVLGIFPEGTRSRDGKLHDPEPGLALLASKVKDVTMVPVAIRGNYKFFSRIDVIFGEPKSFSEYHKEDAKLNSEKLKEMSSALFEEVSNLMNVK